MAKRKPKPAARCIRTVSVPPGLNERMRKAGDTINWSAIAVAAFERELQTQKNRSVQMTVVERLRKSMEQAVQDDYDEGLAAGRTWATGSAEFRELRRLANFRRDCGSDFGQVVRGSEGASSLACTILNDPDADVREFWHSAAPCGDVDDADWLSGFVDGALLVWDEVANKL